MDQLVAERTCETKPVSLAWTDYSQTCRLLPGTSATKHCSDRMIHHHQSILCGTIWNEAELTLTPFWNDIFRNMVTNVMLSNL